ncbi:MAG TPA: response regulator [Bacteroidales bacterium]|nr:response regulator [Bacteroidales bacterium]
MRKTVLIIEDNDQNMYLLTYLLEDSGYNVIQAFDGFTGKISAMEHTPDIILLDIQLPGMDGYSVARELRSVQELRSVPVIAVTSYAMPGDEEKARESGATGYIEKPINTDTFISEIEKFIK